MNPAEPLNVGEIEKTERFRVEDVRLNEFAAGLHVVAPSRQEIIAMAEELSYRRKTARRDSRRADQVKRMRWVVENLLTKIEALSKQDAEIELGKENADG